MTSDSDTILDHNEIQEPIGSIDNLLNELEARCNSANIVFERETLGEYPAARLRLPAGRKTVDLVAVGAAKIGALSSFQFEKYRMLGDFLGFYSHEEDFIEARLQPLPSGTPLAHPWLAARRLLGLTEDREQRTDSIVLTSDDPNNPITLTIGKPSADLDTVTDFLDMGARTKWLSIRLDGLRAQSHAEVLTELERITNSLFFHIELVLGVSLSLVRTQALEENYRRRIPTGSRDDLRFPKRFYSPEPMSLYWYARGAAKMPLLQFLALYQVLEYFMPIYSNNDAISRARNVLKDPRFSLDKDPDMVRLLTALNMSNRGFGDEKSQLESVLLQCVDSAHLLEFITTSEHLAKYYNNGYKNIASTKINIKGKSVDVLRDTAHRLYEIRCRIVHTKDSGDSYEKALLPHSKEVPELYSDIAVIGFIAKTVIIASGYAM